MAESIWQGGKLSHVYTPVGRRANGSKRYQLAGFETLQWDSGSGNEDFYIIPTGGSLMGVDIDLADLDAQIGLDFGFYHLEPTVMDACEADGGSDSWKACHYLGLF